MKITVTDQDGNTKTFEPEEDWSLMESIRDAGMAILAECGGALACATCHVYIADSWMAKLEPASDDEKDMLEEAFEPKPTSRLSCQITMTPDLDGLEVTIAPGFD